MNPRPGSTWAGRARWTLVVAVVLLPSVILACSQPTGSAPTAPSGAGAVSERSSTSSGQVGELRVFAAASLTDAFNELGATFESQNPGAKIVFNFGPSSGLRTQIENGATADLYASADQAQMDQAKKAGVIVGEPKVFAKNVLTLITPAGNPGNVQTLADLARPGVRIVMTNPQVPVGMYTRDVLQNMSHSDAYGPGFARSVQDNVKSEEEDVRSIVAKITLGEADAGVVYTSDVTPRIASQVQTIPIPEQYNVVASYPIATVQGAHQPELARRFMDLVLSDMGQATIAKWGLQKAS